MRVPALELQKLVSHLCSALLWQVILSGSFIPAHLGSLEKLPVTYSMGAWIIFLPSCCTPCFSISLLLYLSLLMFQKCFHGSCIYSHPDDVEGHVNTCLTKGRTRAPIFWEVLLCENLPK